MAREEIVKPVYPSAFEKRIRNVEKKTDTVLQEIAVYKGDYGKPGSPGNIGQGELRGAPVPTGLNGREGAQGEPCKDGVQEPQGPTDLKDASGTTANGGNPGEPGSDRPAAVQRRVCLAPEEIKYVPSALEDRIQILEERLVIIPQEIAVYKDDSGKPGFPGKMRQRESPGVLVLTGLSGQKRA